MVVSRQWRSLMLLQNEIFYRRESKGLRRAMPPATPSRDPAQSSLRSREWRVFFVYTHRRCNISRAQRKR